MRLFEFAGFSITLVRHPWPLLQKKLVFFGFFGVFFYAIFDIFDTTKWGVERGAQGLGRGHTWERAHIAFAMRPACFSVGGST
jgi:hypothetical protein